MGFNYYLNLKMNALCTRPYSGATSEESSILNFSAISLRKCMETAKAQNTGSIILTKFPPAVNLSSISLSLNEKTERTVKSIPDDYQIEDMSRRVVKLTMGNTKLSKKCWGVK